MSGVEQIDADITKAREAIANREAALATATEAVSRLTAERAQALADGEAGVRLRTQAREIERQVEDAQLALPVLEARLAELRAARRQAAIRDGDESLAAELRDVEDKALAEGEPTIYLAARRAWIGLQHDLYQLAGDIAHLTRARSSSLQGRLSDDAYREARIAPRAPLPAALAGRLDAWQAVFAQLIADDADRQQAAR